MKAHFCLALVALCLSVLAGATGDDDWVSLLQVHVRKGDRPVEYETVLMSRGNASVDADAALAEALSARGFSEMDIDQERAPNISATDAAGKVLVMNEEPSDSQYPITMKVAFFVKEAESFSVGDMVRVKRAYKAGEVAKVVQVNLEMPYPYQIATKDATFWVPSENIEAPRVEDDHESLQPTTVHSASAFLTSNFTLADNVTVSLISNATLGPRAVARELEGEHGVAPPPAPAVDAGASRTVMAPSEQSRLFRTYLACTLESVFAIVVMVGAAAVFWLHTCHATLVKVLVLFALGSGFCLTLLQLRLFTAVPSGLLVDGLLWTGLAFLGFSGCFPLARWLSAGDASTQHGRETPLHIFLGVALLQWLSTLSLVAAQLRLPDSSVLQAASGGRLLAVALFARIVSTPSKTSEQLLGLGLAVCGCLLAALDVRSWKDVDAGCWLLLISAEALRGGLFVLQDYAMRQYCTPALDLAGQVGAWGLALSLLTLSAAALLGAPLKASLMQHLASLTSVLMVLGFCGLTCLFELSAVAIVKHSSASLRAFADVLRTLPLVGAAVSPACLALVATGALCDEGAVSICAASCFERLRSSSVGAKLRRGSKGTYGSCPTAASSS